MKFILALCLLFFSFAAPAQLTQATLDMLTKSMALLEKGEYEKIIPIAEKAIAPVKKELGENHAIYNDLYLILGTCHYMLYHYTEAEKNYLKHKEGLARISGENDVSYAACLSRLANLYRDMGKYQQALALLLQAQSISKNIFGVNNADYSKCLNNLALLYADMADFAKAEQLYIESGNILKSIVGENNASYASNLNNLGTLYTETGKYEKALALLVRVLEIRKQVLGENHADYGEALNNLAHLYSTMNRYTEAEANFVKANEIFKKSLGEESPYYAVGLNNLAQFYQTTGRYEIAEQLFIKVRDIRKKILGENHSDYATTLSNLAGLFVSTGQLEKAEQLFIQSKEIKRKAFGEVHPDYAISLNNLASLYETMGQYNKAELLYLESIAIKKKILGEMHTGFAVSLNNLGLLYFNIGQYEKAEPYFVRAMEINKGVLGENNPEYATSLNNAGNVWQSMEKYSQAELAFTRAMEINKKTFGSEHPNYATNLNNLAALYTEMSQYKKAEPLIVLAKDIWKKAFGVNSPAYATSVNNLASFYRKSHSQYAKSEALYLEAVTLRKAILGSNHPNSSESQNDLGLLYTHMGQYKKAEPLFLASSQILLQNITSTFAILSEKEKGKFLDYNRSLVESNNSFLYNYPTPSDAAIENNYNLELGFKSLALADTRNILEAVRNSKDSAVKRKLNQWIANKNLLAKQYELPATNRITDLKKIEDEAEALEKELNRLSSDFRSQQEAVRVTMQDVQKNLEDGEAAIEFIKFKLYNKKWTDSVMYAAFIIRKDEVVPRFVKLCEKTQLQVLFDSAGSTASRLVKSLYRGIEIKSKEARLGIELYKLVWEPLEPFLKGIKKVSYSPAGKLYSIAFNALPIDSNTILMDKYRLQQYTSTRQIALRTATTIKEKPGSIILFGNALFTMDSLQLVQQRNSRINNAITATSATVAKNRGAGSGVWIDLPGTADEVQKIGQLFEQNKIQTKSFTQASASEENFKKLTGKAPPILHIATHGFFLPEPGKKKQSGTSSASSNVFAFAKDPLLRSGLVLAGGNYAWSGKTPVDGMEDGIATAYEISQLNLSNTQLVVLSACETALGDIKGSEGVFGLQRGFKIAGVKKMIVSLWQVPDKETAELMTSLYSYWLSGKTVSESFYQAQSDMRKKYAAYYWAAFVLVE